MADFNEALNIVLKNEGGYVNSKYDSGGETNWGITKETARKFGYKGEMKDLPIETAKEIYKKGYWEPLHLSEVTSQNIANEIFDTAVICGVGTAAKFVQRTLNVLNRNETDWKDIKVDGIIGNETIFALNTAIKKRESNILITFGILQGYRYIEIAEQRKKDEFNINGWINRIKLMFKKII